MGANGYMPLPPSKKKKRNRAAREARQQWKAIKFGYPKKMRGWQFGDTGELSTAESCNAIVVLCVWSKSHIDKFEERGKGLSL